RDCAACATSNNDQLFSKGPVSCRISSEATARNRLLVETLANLEPCHSALATARHRHHLPVHLGIGVRGSALSVLPGLGAGVVMKSPLFAKYILAGRMNARRALAIAAVLIFGTPITSAFAHDDDYRGFFNHFYDHLEHQSFHQQFNQEHNA